jgi:hypothetical protein
VAVWFVKAQVTSKDGSIAFLAPRHMVIDKKEMAVFVEFKNYRIDITFYQRATLDDGW